MTFKLERRLFRGKQQQRRTFGPCRKLRPDLREAAIGLAAARRAEKEGCLQPGEVKQENRRGKEEQERQLSKF